MLEKLRYDQIVRLSGSVAGQPVSELLKKAYGGSGSLADRESAFLTSKGAPVSAGSRQDRWCKYLSVTNVNAALDKLRGLSSLP